MKKVTDLLKEIEESFWEKGDFEFSNKQKYAFRPSINEVTWRVDKVESQGKFILPKEKQYTDYFSNKVGKIVFSINDKNKRLRAAFPNNIVFIGGKDNDGYFDSVKEAQDWVEKNAKTLEGIKSMQKLIYTQFTESLLKEVAEENISSIFEKAKTILLKNKIPCKISYDREIDIELGWNYPDRLADKVFDVLEKAGIDDSYFRVSAETSGGKKLETTRLNGGPKRY